MFGGLGALEEVALQVDLVAQHAFEVLLVGVQLVCPRLRQLVAIGEGAFQLFRQVGGLHVFVQTFKAVAVEELSICKLLVQKGSDDGVHVGEDGRFVDVVEALEPQGESLLQKGGHGPHVLEVEGFEVVHTNVCEVGNSNHTTHLTFFVPDQLLQGHEVEFQNLHHLHFFWNPPSEPEVEDSPA